MSLCALLLASAASVTGQVTFVAHDHLAMGVLQPADGAHPIWFSGEPDSDPARRRLVGADALKAGDIVSVRGEITRLGFAPGFELCDITYLGPGELSEPKELRLGDLDHGRLDNVRVSLRGVLTGVRKISAKGFVQLHLAAPDGSFSADVPETARDWQGLIDAELRLEGVAMSIFNIRSEFAGVLLQVVRPEHVRVLAEPIDPFSRPVSALQGILPFSPGGIDLHRRHVRGTVTYCQPGEFLWLADGEETLKVLTGQTDSVPGDVVEAVGFVDSSEGLGQLKGAVVRKVGCGELPAAIPITRYELTGYPFKNGRFICYDGRRVVFEGKLLSFVGEGQSSRLLVESDTAKVDVVNVRSEELSSDDVAWEPTLRVTGILELRQKPGDLDGQLPKIDGWAVRAESVEVVHDGAWQRHQAAKVWQAIRVGLFGLALMVIAVILAVILRMRSSRKAVDLLANERKRMAADLHDTVEQHLATARMMLNSAVRFSPNVPEEVRTAVAEVNDILAHAKSDVRERIMNMRSDVLFSGGLKKALETLAEKVGKSGVIDFRTRLRGLPESLGEQVFSEIIFIVGEAITNAVKHGKCSHVVLASDPAEKGFSISVANDGAPFDPDRVLGPEAGHYGLSGMRERAKRANLGLDFLRDGRWMVVRLTCRNAQ